MDVLLRSPGSQAKDGALDKITSSSSSASTMSQLQCNCNKASFKYKCIILSYDQATLDALGLEDWEF